ncbi:MAG TPA: BcsE family c-di-GMP-binding protein [Burkholderiaceae bacterium]|nr:BcsE family c-di-GMP-binding protein [Burkholderiaceae bacterium]
MLHCLSLEELSGPVPVPSLTLQARNLYAILSEEDALLDRLLWKAALAASSPDMGITVVTASEPSRNLRRCGLAGDVRRAVAAGQLHIVVADMASSDTSVSIARLQADLAHWCADRRPLLFIQGAERFFSRLDAEALRTWRQWAEAHATAITFFFRAEGAQADGLMASLLPLSPLLAGLAWLKSGPGGACANIAHWFGAAGLAVTSIRATAHSDNQSSTLKAADALAIDERLVFMQAAALGRLEKLPAEWRLLEREGQWWSDDTAPTAATVILGCTAQTDYATLVHHVFDLRRRCGARLKILVREVGGRLRYSQEMQLIHMGANLVVPAQVPYVRFLSLVAMVQGQIFPHSLPVAFDTVTQSLLAVDAEGYLPPDRFVAVVERQLEKMRLLQVHCVLLRMVVASSLAPLDVLRHCDVRRAGDVCTADERHIYLFLPGCRETDVDGTLERLFGLPLGTLFAGEERFFALHAIRDLIAVLVSRQRKHPMPDLSAALAGMPRAVHGTADARPATECADPAIERFMAPAPAVRRALAVKRFPVLVDVSSGKS